MASSNTAAPAVIRSFFEFVQSADNDTLGGNIDYQYLVIDPNNRNQSTSPSHIKRKITDITKNGAVTPIGLVDGQGRLLLIFFPHAVTPSMMGLTSTNEGTFIGQLGDVDGADSQLYLYAVPDAALALIANNVMCASADAAKAAAQQHTGAGDFEMGPFTSQDAGTTVVSTRRFFVVPFFLVMHFLSVPTEADVVLEFWKVIYPIIEQEGRVAECAALINYFLVAATKKDAAETVRQTRLTDAERPTAIGRDDAVMTWTRSLLKRLYPDIFSPTVSAVNAGQQRLVDAMDKGNEIAEKALEAKLEKQGRDATDKVLKTCGDAETLKYLLDMFGASDTDGLPETIQQLLKCTTKSDKDKLLRRRLIKVCQDDETLGEPPCLPPGTGHNLCNNYWHMETPHEPGTGCGAINPFLLHGPKSEMKEAEQDQRLSEQHNIAIAKEDQKEVDKTRVFLSTTLGISELVRKQRVLWLGISHDPKHPVTEWLGEYWKLLSANLNTIVRFPTKGGYSKNLIGVELQNVIAKELEKYSRAIASQGKFSGQLNKRLVLDIVSNSTANQHWENISATVPALKEMFPSTFAALQAQGSGGTWAGLNDDITVSGAAAALGSRLQFGSDASVMVGGNQGVWSDEVSQIGDVADTGRTSTAPPRQAQRSRPSTNSSSHPATGNRRTNKVYNDDASNALKRAWRESGAKCGSTKKAAKDGVIPPLPRSKAEGHGTKPMCLNWHVMGECYDDCGEGYDHEVVYQEEELSGLTNWVGQHATRRPEDERSRGRRNGRRGRGNRNE
jgi:hypothetical protein